MKEISAQVTARMPASAYGRPFINLLLAGILAIATVNLSAQAIAPDKVRNDFISLLQRPAVDPHPFFAIVSTDSAIVEKGYFYSEANEKVPLLVYRPLTKDRKKLPVVICLHGTGGSKDDAGIRQLLYRFSNAGFMAVSIDGRYHGERSTAGPGHNSYVEAITRAWENKDTARQTHPFFFDTVYDVWKLVDYLVTRTDVDAGRIGLMGISKGGIETWMEAAIDKRIKVVVPVIAVQSFRWSLDNERWQGRAHTIWGAHVQAAKDLGDSDVNSHNVQIFWNKLLPGITGEFDCPSMLRLIAPRPLLILSTEEDQNCPLPGAKIAFATALAVYKENDAMQKIQMNVAPHQPHRFTDAHLEMAIEWFIKWL